MQLAVGGSVVATFEHLQCLEEEATGEVVTEEAMGVVIGVVIEEGE